MKLRKLLSAAVLFMSMMICAGISASAESLVLEYDGAEHIYSGSLYDLEVNEAKIETPLQPILFNDRALVPIREVFEALGANVSYTQETRSVDVIKEGTYVRLSINDNTAYVNGVKTAIPDNVVPKLIAKKGDSAKTMVPVRFVSESIGLDVDFLQSENTISIKDPAYIAAAPTEAPTQAPVPTEAPAATAAPVVSAQTGLKSVTVNGSAVTITADAAIEKLSHFTLTEPDRIVIDLYGAKNKTGTESVKGNSGSIQGIRIGEPEGKTRVVLDMSGSVSYTAELSADKKTVTVSIGAANTVVTTAKPVAQPTAKPTEKPTSAPSPVTANKGEKLIYIDAGHGGQDSGAVGLLPGQTVYEKDLTLSIAKKVRAILDANGYLTAMTREGDTYPTLTERADMANAAGAAVFVSVHINAHEQGSAANGIEVYYAEKNNGSEYGLRSQELAQNIYDRMIAATGATERGVKTANHSVTRRSEMPATLVEVGFITNVDECSKMVDEDYQETVAKAIAEGIMVSVGKINMPG